MRIIKLNNPKGFIAIQKGKKSYPAFGATRLWNYKNEKEALKDARRLAKIMSYKSAMAGFQYGGGKGVIMMGIPKKDYSKNEILKAYADQINKLNGAFITGGDVGLNKKDILFLKKLTPYIVGVKNDPIEFSVLGLKGAIEVSLNEKFGEEVMNGRSFAVQGLGKIGQSLIKLIYNRAEKIFASDTNKAAVKTVKKRFPKVKIVSPVDICKKKVDIFSPCALESIDLNTARTLRCSIIVGGANNQLASNKVGDLLWKKGILYAPDYVVNAGGLISVVDEYENKTYNYRRVREKVLRIKPRLSNIFHESRKKNKSPHRITDALVKNILN